MNKHNNFSHIDRKLLAVSMVTIQQTAMPKEKFPPYSKFIGEDAILLLRPKAWPPKCARFCLFVMRDDREEMRPRYEDLLYVAIEEKWVLGEKCPENRHGLKARVMCSEIGCNI